MSNDAQAYPTQHRNHEHAALLSGGSDGKEPGAVQEIQVPSLGWEDSLEEGMATQSTILAWRIPWTEKLGRLHSP